MFTEDQMTAVFPSGEKLFLSQISVGDDGVLYEGYDSKLGGGGEMDASDRRELANAMIRLWTAYRDKFA